MTVAHEVDLDAVIAVTTMTDAVVTVEVAVHVPAVVIARDHDPGRITGIEAGARCPGRALGPDRGTRSRQDPAVITTRAAASEIANVTTGDPDHVPLPTASNSGRSVTAQARVRHRAHLRPPSPMSRANRALTTEEPSRVESSREWEE